MAEATPKLIFMYFLFSPKKHYSSRLFNIIIFQGKQAGKNTMNKSAWILSLKSRYLCVYLIYNIYVFRYTTQKVIKIKSGLMFSTITTDFLALFGCK